MAPQPGQDLPDVAIRTLLRQRVLMARKRWNDLSPQARRLILIGGIIEGTLKVAALVDLVRRPAHDIRGSKSRWATAIIVMNSGGLVPVVYFARGRRRR